MVPILPDSCVWSGVLPVLIHLGHDVVWSGSWQQDPGDAAILAVAHAQRRVLITLDKDFGELAIVKGLPHSGMVRLSGFRAGQMAETIHSVKSIYQQELAAAAIITVEPDRIRVRPSS